MPQPELLAFFRANTQDLPETTQRWFQLPNTLFTTIRSLGSEIQTRVVAGEDLASILGLAAAPISEDAKGFLDLFVQHMKNLDDAREEEDAINVAKRSLVLAAESFSGTDLRVVNKTTFEIRGVVQRHLIEQGALQPLPYGHRLRSFCALSAGIDFMRADLESGKVTGGSLNVAKCFGDAEMDLLDRMAIRKSLEGAKLSEPIPIHTYSQPSDPEIRAMQSRILARLIPG